MKIVWNKPPETEEGKIVLDYLVNKSDIIEHIKSMVKTLNLLSLTFTHRTYESSFFTYEFKKDQRAGILYVFVWKGLRAGDTSPLIFGRILDENAHLE